jgi:hypothetical protein
MSKVLLLFPDAVSMAVFMAAQKIVNSEVNYRELFLMASLSELQIELACTQYKAVLQDSFYTLNIYQH